MFRDRMNERDVTSIRSVREALQLLEGGEEFVICSSSQEPAASLLRQAIASAPKKQASLVSFASTPDAGVQKHLGRLISIGKDQSARATIDALKSSLAKVKRESVLCIDCTSVLPSAFHSARSLHDLLHAIETLATQKRLAVSWFVRREVFDAGTLAYLKDISAFFLDIRRAGSIYVAQFLAARAISDPEFFTPRVLSITKSDATFSSSEETFASATSSALEAAEIIDQQYKRIFDRAAEPMILFELRGNYRQFNARAKEMFGGEDAELATTFKLSELVPKENYVAFLRSLCDLRKKGSASFATRLRRKGGRLADIHVVAFSIGKNTYSAICRDISDETKQQEHAHALEQEYRAFVGSLPYPYAIFVNRKLIAKNALFDKLFPWIENDSPSVTAFFGKRNADVLREIAAFLDDSAPGNFLLNREVIIPAPDRKTVAAEVSVSSLHYESKRALLCTFVDVSERRRILDAAEETEQKFQSLIEKSIDGVALYENERFTLVNGKLAEMFGYDSSMDLIGKEITAIVAGRNARKEILDQEQRRSEGKEIPSRYEYLGLKRDGTKISVEVEATTIQLNGEPATLAFYRDVTQHKLSDEILDRKARGMELVNCVALELAEVGSVDAMYQRALNSAIRGTQFEAGGVFAVDHAESILRLTHHRLLSERMVEKVGTQSLDDGFARFFGKTHEPLIVPVAEYPAYLHHKSLFEAEQFKSVAFLPLVVSSRFEGVLLLASKKESTIDEVERAILASLATQLSSVLEKNVLADRLRAAQARYYETVENVSDILYTLKPDGSFIEMTPNIARLLGFTPQDFQTNAGLWRTLLHPDDRPIISKRVSTQASRTDHFTLEYRIQPKGKATYSWVEDQVRYHRDSTGKLVFINGIVRDITDRKMLASFTGGEPREPASLDVEKEIFHSLPEAVVLIDNELNCTEWNTELEKITGVAYAEVVGKHINDLPVLREALRAGCDHESTLTQDISFTVPHSNESGELRVRSSPWRTLDGERLGTIAVIANLTGTRKLERQITESEETLRNVLEAMGDALLITDMQGEVWEVNREFTRLTGYARDEVRLSKFPYPWMVDAEIAGYLRWVADLQEKRHLHDLDMTWKHKDGHEFAMSLNTTLLTNAAGEAMAILNVAREISDRRKLILELEWKNKQIELLNRIISYANTTMDLEDIFSTIAAEVHSLLAYNGVSIAFLDHSQELVPWYLAVPTETGESHRVTQLAIDPTIIYDAVRLGRAVTKQRASGETFSQVTIPLYVNEKALGAFSLISSRANAFGAEELSFLQPVADQIGAIIQRVRLFQQVSEDSSYIHALLNSIDNVVYTVDQHYRITEVNEAWRDFAMRQELSYLSDGSRIIGQSLQVVTPDPELWNHYKRVMDDLFARRTESYSRDFEVTHDGGVSTYHLVINPMVLNNKVTALVFTHTDITEIHRTEAEITRRNKELLALNAIATSINRSLEWESVIRVAAEQLKDAFDATVVAFYLIDEAKQTLVLSRYLGISEETASRIGTLDMTISPLGQVIKTRRPMYFSGSSSTDPDVAELGKRMHAALGLRSSGIVPLQSKNKIQGVFVIAFSRAHAFGDKEQQLLLLIGNQIGSALENAHLYAEVQQQVTTLTTLYELGKGLTGLLDLNSMLQVVYREVAHSIPVDRFYYQVFVPEDNMLSLLSRIVDGNAEYYPSGVNVRGLRDWPTTIYQEVVEHGTPYMGSIGAETSDSIIAVPIKSNDKVVGIVSILTAKPHEYSDTHLRLLESITNLMGIAIGKAALYEDTLRKTAEIENRNKDLDDFTYVVSHDLKEPLISIEGYSKIVMKDYKEKLDEEGKEHLAAVVQSTTRMKSLIDDLLTLSRLGRMHEEYESVSVRNIIDEILHDLQFTLRQRNVAVQVTGDLPSVRYSSTRLSMVFRNLISNAMKFNDKPDPTITIDVEEREHEYVFSVADNGIGIERQYFDRIFTIFQRLKRSEEYRGTGAGLTIVKRIVETEGGKVWLDAAPGVGSTFYFTIKKVV